jgi:hypothetical protein
MKIVEKTEKRVVSQTYGLLAKNGGTTKTKDITMYACPSCDSSVEKDAASCQVCGAVFDGVEGGSPSRLSDNELSEKMELLLQKSRKKKTAGMLSVIGAFVVSFPLLLMIGGFAYVIFFALLALGVVYLIQFSGVQNQMKTLVGANIIRDMLADVFELESYQPSGSFTAEQVRQTGLINGWDECSGSDLVKGKYKGIPFSFSDIKLVSVTETTDDEGKTQTSRTTMFQGQWMEIYLNKQIESVLYVRERLAKGGLKNAILGKVGEKLDKVMTRKMNKEIQEAQTENTAFNKKYQILTDDPHTMFYILTPHFMEYIVSADTAANGQTNFCFTGDRVRVALQNTLDFFEIGNIKSVSDIEGLRAKFRSEMRYIVGILDELLKNEFLFGTEEK